MITRQYLLQRDKEDKRDFLYAAPARVEKLPESVDLRTNDLPIFDQGHLGSCHDIETEVLTRSGWQYFCDITVDDELATVDPVTKTLIFEKPSNITKYPYSGDMICSNHQSLDFKVTPNHIMLVRKWNERNRTLDDCYELVEAGDLGWYTGLLTEVKYDGIHNEVLTLPAVEHKRGLGAPREVSMRHWLRFVGIYLAEGTLIRSNSCHYKVQLASYTLVENEFIAETLSELGINYLKLDDRFTFENKQIYEVLCTYGLSGVRAPFKFVPDFIFDLSPELIEEFLLGFFMGDGHRNHDNRMFYTTSEQMAGQLQILILLSGKWNSLYSRPPRMSFMSDGREIVGKYNELTICEWTTANLSITRKCNIRVEHYKGMVYCAEVPSFHTLVTRRNGKMLISGNCTANAICALKQYIDCTDNADRIGYGYYHNLSRLYLYWHERSLMGTTSIDSGAYIRDGMKVLQQRGCCGESFYPYDQNRFRDTPTAGAEDNAGDHKIGEYYRIYPVQLRSVLADGLPVVMGMDVYASFESEEVACTGYVPMPQLNEQYRGGHAVLVMGYTPTHLIVRNSWGEAWGERGYFYLPWEYLDHYVGDLWAGR